MFVIVDGHPARISHWNPNKYRSSWKQRIIMKEQQPFKLDEYKEIGNDKRSLKNNYLI